jgi:hypothetical protein
MDRTRIGTIAISMLALLLFAGGIVYIAKGIAMPWVRGEAIDLELRSAEYEYFAEGIYPHRRVAEATSGEKIKKHTVYPPYAFVMFSAFCWPDTKEAERLIFQIISVAGLILMAIYGARTLGFAGRPAMLLGFALPLAFSGNYVSFFQGQFSIISVALITAQLWLLQTNRPSAAGLCWALAMIKPQVALAFGLLFLLRREYWRGLLVGLGVLAAMTAFALWWTSTPPSIFWEQGVSRQRLVFVEKTAYAAAVWVQGFGIPPRTATVAGLGVLVITGLAFLTAPARKILDLPRAAALCSVLGLSLFYHVHYDNMMLFPLLLALVASALKNNRLLVWAAAAMLAAICYGEPGIIVGWAQSNAFARWFIFLCPLAACAVLLLANKDKTKQRAFDVAGP